ncbi:ComEC/Rec2 family competence protein [Nocardioides rubriscoriae]|uniref:ComEC/Rec2 family competence protein n=1 Tax=Nocardioides rubriscoriae TaxID=642762 RepID=UPI001FE774FD|nr:ComEC/Rec2 family competence protein [Nocardioides rubriscoriae]
MPRLTDVPALGPAPGQAPGPGAADLRMPLLAVASWVGGLAAQFLPSAVAVPAVLGIGGALLAVTRVRRRPGELATVLAGLLVAAGVLTSALVRAEAVAHNPVADLAGERAVVEVVAVVVSDPQPVSSPFGDQVAVRLEVREVVGRGLVHRVAVPVLVLGDPAWADEPWGATVRTHGRLVVPDGDRSGLSALLTGAAAPQRLREPDLWWRGAGAMRASIRASVAHRPDDQRALVPALVDGDDAALDPGLVNDFKATGLTHLTAVSGTNLTLVVGFLLVLARWCRVRGRWLALVAVLGIGGFVLLARTEPSVVRAAAMGTVGLLAMGSNGRRRATRGLAVAVVVLLLVQPALAVAAGFVLSVLATAGIVLLAPGWRDALARWLPRWLAEAVAVPFAAQVACTPVVAALSGQVSLVAVLANLVVAPVVGPATVLGLTGGLTGLVVPALGRLLGTGAAWCVGWIATVARAGADLPLPTLDWGTDAWSLAALTVGCLALTVLAPVVLRSPRLTVPLVATAVVATTVPLPTPGWPDTGWVMAMCDVGQGDALVLHAGPRSGVVVDAGPDPAAVDRCLDDLGIDQVPLLVLTHFHADHVAGLPGVLEGRTVGAVWTTSLLDPPAAVGDVVSATRAAGVVPTLPAIGARRVGDVVLQAVWPRPGPPVAGPGDGSTANNASVVLVADVGSTRILLTGDVEPPGQAALAVEVAGLDVDVLKVPHHGSRYQDLPWLLSLHAEVALVSVGADNDYGHPSRDLVAALADAGADVRRTDQDGDVLVLPTDGGGVEVRSRGG